VAQCDTVRGPAVQGTAPDELPTRYRSVAKQGRSGGADWAR